MFQRKLSRRRLPITFVYFLSHASTKVLRPIKFAQRSRSIFLMSIDRKNTLVENFELLISSKYINIFIRSQSKMLYVSREACCRKTIFTSTCKLFLESSRSAKCILKSKLYAFFTRPPKFHQFPGICIKLFCNKLKGTFQSVKRYGEILRANYHFF